MHLQGQEALSTLFSFLPDQVQLAACEPTATNDMKFCGPQ